MFLIGLLTVTTIAISTFLYKIDAHNIIYATCERKYKKWKKINELVATKHESLKDIYLVSFNIILKSLYLSFVQYLNNSVTKIDKNSYQVEYIVGGKLYKMIVIPKKGPSNIIQVLNQDDEDITEFIMPYYGPNYDWHSISFIPQFFRCKEMAFELDDGTEKIFGELDYINL